MLRTISTKRTDSVSKHGLVIRSLIIAPLAHTEPRQPVFDGGVTDNFGGTYYQKGDHAVFHVRQQNGVTIEGLEIRNTLGHACA